MVTSNLISPKIFISYSWDSEEHKQRVLKVTQYLKAQGIDCRIDQDYPGLNTPKDGWLLWMLDQLEQADFVLIICTKIYQQRMRRKNEVGGRGAAWEGAVIMQELYNSRFQQHQKYIPVILDREDEQFIPLIMQSVTPARLYLKEGAEVLAHHLKDQQLAESSYYSPLLKLTSSTRHLKEAENTKLRRALVRTLKDLENDQMLVICAIVLDTPSEIRKIPRKQPDMCIHLINELDSLNRLTELTEYLEEDYPELMKKIHQ